MTIEGPARKEPRRPSVRWRSARRASGVPRVVEIWSVLGGLAGRPLDEGFLRPFSGADGKGSAREGAEDGTRPDT